MRFWSIMMLYLLNEKDNLYLSLLEGMSDSDGICNKVAMCVLKKLKSQRNKEWYMKQEGTCRIALCVNR